MTNEVHLLFYECVINVVARNNATLQNLMILVMDKMTIKALCWDVSSDLERITWDCSKEGRKALPIAQTGTCGKVAHLLKTFAQAV